MSQTLGNELNLVGALQRVHEDLVCLSAEGNESSSRANLNCKNLVWVVNLSNRAAFIAIPEVDGSTLSAGNKLELIIHPLRHAKE